MMGFQFQQEICSPILKKAESNQIRKMLNTDYLKIEKKLKSKKQSITYEIKKERKKGDGARVVRVTEKMRNETRIRRTVAGIQGEKAVNEWVKQRVVSAVDRGIPKNVECRGRIWGVILHCRNLRQFPVSCNDETHH